VTKAQLQKRLDKLAIEINELHEALEKEHGEGSHLYFEAGGNIYAMKPEDPSHMRRDTTVTERQSGVIALSDHCHFDCGAW